MQLGKVEKLAIRDQWKNEEYDFTPWLAKEENIQLLGDEINIDLDLEVEGIKLSRSGDSKAQTQLPLLYDWLKSKSEACYEVFSPKLKALNI